MAQFRQKFIALVLPEIQIPAIDDQRLYYEDALLAGARSNSAFLSHPVLH